MHNEEHSLETDLPFDLDELTIEPLSLCDPAVCVKMTDMLAIQDSLNNKFLGEDWKSEASHHHRVDYLPAILDEAAELMRSHSQWKFWKKPSPSDLENAKLEFIDMLHFAMSEELAKSGELTMGSGVVENVAEDMSAGYEFAYQTVPNLQEDGLPVPTTKPAFNFQRHKSALFRYLASVFLYYEVIDGASSDMGQDDFEQDRGQVCDEEALSLDAAATSMRVTADWAAFWGIAFHLGVTLEEVYLTYVSKVSLNELRITRGDKSGEYKRLWWGDREDNYFLMRYVRSVLLLGGASSLTRGDVASWLNSSYEHFLIGGAEPAFYGDPSHARPV